MNIAETFIRRPVMTTLVMMGILIFGIMSYRDHVSGERPDTHGWSGQRGLAPRRM